jgi:hypothetical protein
MHYYFVAETGEIIASETPNADQAGVHFTTPEELAASDVSTADMLKWFNSDKGDKAIKKFANRLVGAQAIFKELGHLSDEEQDAAQADADKRAAAAPAASGGQETTKSDGPQGSGAAAGGDAPAASSGRKGRASQYAGKTLIGAVKENQEGAVVNPRRDGTPGHKSLGLILAAGKTGISYEDFIAGGGRNQDLLWDIAHDNVKVA